MGVLSLANALAAPDPAPTWRFYVYMPTINGIDLNPSNLYGSGGFNVGSLLSDIISLSGGAGPDNQGIIVESISFIHPRISNIPRFGYATNVYYPGFEEVEACQITFYETVNYQVTRYLENWRRRVRHQDGSYGMPGEYKRNIIFNAYGYYNDVVQAMQGELTGCWPVDQGAYQYNYSESNRVVVSATFSVDRRRIIS